MRLTTCLLPILLLVSSATSAGAGDLSDVIVQCAACHGADGIAKSADVPHLAGA
ncbi:MAG: cytochrome c, partial [Alphaproteobacteria bacterium]|nr:cytochrome c [Alphaproteobacteria bacterium]